MTSPRLALDSPYGRVYRHPRTPLDAIEDPVAAVRGGLLVPSVTNVIAVMDKPFLQRWHARMAAEAAVQTAQDHPGLIQQRPAAAREYFKDAAPRAAAAAADLGTEVHAIVEALGRGMDPGPVPDRSAAYVDAWRAFVADFAPVFAFHEATCFGAVGLDGQSLGYAGTADAIVDIGGVTAVVDYKSGRSVHTEAALQLSALANASEIVRDDDTAVPMPRIDVGLVVHLTPRGYAAHPTAVTGTAWDAFSGLRRVWGFHAENLASRGPLLIGKALRDPDALAAFQRRD